MRHLYNILRRQGDEVYSVCSVESPDHTMSLEQIRTQIKELWRQFQATQPDCDSEFLKVLEEYGYSAPESSSDDIILD